MRNMPSSPSRSIVVSSSRRNPGALLGADQEAAQIAAAEPGDRLDEVEPALPARQAPRQHDDRGILGHPPPRRQRADPLAVDPARIERGDVDPARNDPQAVGADPVNAGDVLGDELRDRDDPLAARHHRIVPVLQRQIGVVGVMKRGHEAPLGGARRRPGAPRRSAAAGMHDVDLVAADDLDQRGGIAAHHQGVLRGERKLQMAHPEAGQLMLHRAPGRGDISGPAGSGERAGEVDGAAFRPAGDEARDDLQHRRRAAFFRQAGNAIVAAHAAAVAPRCPHPTAHRRHLRTAGRTRRF